MNYAWSNPTTRIREQTENSTPERMLAEAKRRVWQELQEAKDWDCSESDIWLQEPIGEVTVNGLALDPARVIEAESIDNARGEEHFLAWCDPETGKRHISDTAPSETIVEQLKRLQNQRDPKDSVVIYATWYECSVLYGDSEPPEVGPEPATVSVPQPGEDSEITARKADIESITAWDESGKVSLHSAWALLDIAGSLRRLFPKPIPPTSFPLGEPMFFDEPQPVATNDGWESPEEKRARVVASRGPVPPDPSKPHMFCMDPSIGLACAFCGKPELDAIHGYTGH